LRIYAEETAGMGKMNSYQRVMACFAGEKPDRVPVVPMVREWCCKQAGIKFADTMNAAEKHVYSQYYCARKFGFDVVTDIMGIHAESEAMGAVVKYGEDYPPTISEAVIEDYGKDLPSLRLPNPHRDGRLPLLLACIARLKELCGGEIPVMGYVQCPFRHAAMLRSAENLMRDTFKNKENARRLLEIATNSQIVWGTAVAQAGADIVFVSDPTSSGDAVSSKTYEDWGLPYTRRVVSAIKETGAKVLMHICGDTSDRLQMLASTGVDGLSLDAKVDFGYARKTLGPNYLLMGNVDPTSPITLGDSGTVYEYSRNVIQQAGEEGHLFLSAGCLIPAGVEHTYYQ
jgi:uroporphyrinogen decarboxylase